MSLNVAIALFVKDEFSDIAGWIAWHAALGVQTFFIYDDHSTDGTWEILQAAAKCYDIRLRRTDSNVPGLTDRQRMSYSDAILECQQDFDWLGFLDGDEYLYLKHFDKLPEFLLHFSHADAIAFSWRIYGSSGQALKPYELIVEAFTQHSSKDFFDNRHVKSFIRPKKIGHNYFNPHHFDIPKEHYARPSGKFITEAHALQDVEWSDGFVMHFICRSMEHYIERIRRRRHEDLSNTTSYWHYFDRNEETDREPLRRIPETERKLTPILQECLKRALLKLKDLPVTPDPTLYPEKSCHKAPEIFKIITHHHTSLYYDPKSGHAVHCQEEIAQKHHFSPLLGAVNPQTEKVITLFASEAAKDSPLKISYDYRSFGRALYRLVPKKDKGQALFNCGSRQFLSFLPPDENGIGKVEANRDKAHEWETITLKKLSDEKVPFTFTKLPFNPSEKTSPHAVLNWIKTAPELPSNEAFLRVLYSLSPHVQQEISNYTTKLLWAFI